MSIASVSDLIAHLDGILEPRQFTDYGPNGLQVPGPDAVEVVVTGVSAHSELFERAATQGAGLVLVHHGLFWKGQPLEVTPLMYARLKPLFEHHIALAAYHLPLDAHPEHGNNALLARALDLVEVIPFADHDGRPIGVHGRFAGDGLALDELSARVEELLGRAPLVVAGGSQRVATLGIVSGGGTDYIHDAAALGLDAFLTGEPAERAFGIARDNGIHFIAAGHHATERLGVQRLGDLLAEEFGIRHVFIDVENPI